MLMITSNLLLFHLYACCFPLLSYHVVASAAAPPFSFSFDDLLFQGDAAVQGGLVNSTINAIGVGRMSYKQPVAFYDNGQAASFSTRFSFAIRSAGMAFFLSSYPSTLSPMAGGGVLGLRELSPRAGPVIPVEFNRFPNTWDVYNHMTTDVDTVRDSTITACFCNFCLNDTMTASITFNNNTRMVVASLHFPDHPSRGSYHVSTQLTNDVMALLPSEVAVGFSAATGTSLELHQILSWSFNSTLAPLPERKEKKILVIGGAVGSLAILVNGSVLVWFILACLRWRRTCDSFARGILGLKRFEYDDLFGPTGRFSEDNTLGAGKFGTIYKGSYTDEKGDQEVVVREIKKTTGAVGDFMPELKTISATRHMNLVDLKGWCLSRNRLNLIDFMCWYRQQRVKLFLVYELVPNGTLEDHLHCSERILPWDKRHQIVKGIGSALRYLHHECNTPILHRDIKANNTLLDYDFNAKLAHFGLPIFAGQSNATLLKDAIGRVRYMESECTKDGNVLFDHKTDVYSFGIVLLEIACRKTRERVMELCTSSAEPWMMEAADERLNGVFDKTQMERVIVLGLKCSHADWKQRPYMMDAMEFLEDCIEMPIAENGSQQRARFLSTFMPSAVLTNAICGKMNSERPPPRHLSYDFLQEITDAFSKDREIGSGTYGRVYLGVDKDGEKIAVKVLYDMPSLDDNDKQFDKEFHNLIYLQHRNIVRFLGYCHETHRECLPYNGNMVLAEVTKRALCFEYMHNGSLDNCLSDESSGHDWHTRYAIIKGVCDGLKYLHEELQPPIFHLDLKPANILLDEDMVPKLADFGLSRLFGEERTQITTSSIGTIGYLPPEYIKRQVISNKFDIFSLGVVIIKIMTGRTGYFECCEMPSHKFIELVHENWRSRLHAKSVYVLGLYSEQVKRCIEIALSCVEADRQQRPSIGDIVSKLNETETMIQKWPNLGI